MKRLASIALMGMLIATPSLAAPVTAPRAFPAPLEIVVFLSSQRMMVIENGVTTHEFVVSSGKSGKDTPTGVFTVDFLSRNHKSSLYNDAPMPNSIFFNGHIALHGTDQPRSLGRAASNGCIRLSIEDSKIPFALVREYGSHNTEIRIVG